MTNLVLISKPNNNVLRMSRVSDKKITSSVEYDLNDSDLISAIEDYRVNDCYTTNDILEFYYNIETDKYDIISMGEWDHPSEQIFNSRKVIIKYKHWFYCVTEYEGAEATIHEVLPQEITQTIYVKVAQ